MAHPLLRAHPLLARLAADLRANPGVTAQDDGNPARAAVAIVLRAMPVASVRTTRERVRIATASDSGWQEVPELEVLLIQRAERVGDPWSGQVALPGGRHDSGDATLQDTAIRETFEETGLDIRASGVVLGALDELRPRTPVLPPIIVTPWVAVISWDAPFGPSDEVAEAFWAPWSLFSDPNSVEESTVLVRGAEWKVDSYVVGHRVVWGMTERMLRQLATRLERLSRD